MTFLRSSRERRIDRALSNVLEIINVNHGIVLTKCKTWRDVDECEAQASAYRTKAYDRANKLYATWERIIANEAQS